MSIPSDYRDLLTTLAERTDKGEVKWKLLGHTVEVLLDQERISMWAGNDERTDEGFVSFALKDKEGEILDLWYLDADDVDYDYLNRVYLAAKRHALGVPDRLARIRDQIKKSTKIGYDEP